mgnify:CR=1 FL=1
MNVFLSLEPDLSLLLTLFDMDSSVEPIPSMYSKSFDAFDSVGLIVKFELPDFFQ